MREEGIYIKIDEHGTKTYYKNKEKTVKHRVDGPAVEYRSGTKFWFSNNILHREDGPAIEWFSGSKSWYVNGKIHREDGPAVEWNDGGKAWYVNGKIHRVDGPAIVRGNGTKEWYVNGVKQVSVTHKLETKVHTNKEAALMAIKEYINRLSLLEHELGVWTNSEFNESNSDFEVYTMYYDENNTVKPLVHYQS